MGAFFRKRTTQTPPSRKERLVQARQYGARDATRRGGRAAGGNRSICRDCLLMILAFAAPVILLETLGNPLRFLHLKDKVPIQPSDQTASQSQTESPISAPTTPATAPAAATVTTRKEYPVTTTTAPNLVTQQLPPPPIPTDPSKASTIAYVVPIWQCVNAEQYIADAALVLKHSIHMQSKRNPMSGSPYDYRMYALVFIGANCQNEKLHDLGYTVIPVESPIVPENIEGAYVRENIGKMADGGHLQFIQLLAHRVVREEEPIVVVMYLNTLLKRPLDDLFHAILHPGSTPEGQTARQNIQSSLLERPRDVLPDTIHHFLVRDYPNTGFLRQPVIMTPGFWVSRRDPDLATKAFALIHKGDHKEGNDPHSGWGSKGYSLYWRDGMTMAGFYAYLLDTFYADTRVELNGCLFHHNGMDNKFRDAPRFHPSLAAAHKGECRSGEQTCDDCTTTNVNSIYTILYDRTCKS